MSKPKSERILAKTAHLRKIERAACVNVLEAYNQVVSVIGTWQAKDYGKYTGGQPAQYNPDRKMGIPFIDFKVDVEHTLALLEPAERERLRADGVLDHPNDLPVQTEETMSVMEKLGRLFIGRKLHPLDAYFSYVKR